MFFGRNDAKAETPILWPPDVKNWLIRKDPDAGRDCKQRRKGRQSMWSLHSITDAMDMSLSKLQESVIDREAWLLQSMGSQRVGQWLSNWTELNFPWCLSDKEFACQYGYIWVRSLGREDPLEKEMQPSPVFLPGKCYGQRSLVSYCPWGHKRAGHDLVSKQQ